MASLNPPVKSSFWANSHGFSMGFPWVFHGFSWQKTSDFGRQEIAPLWEFTETRCGFETEVSGGFFGVISRVKQLVKGRFSRFESFWCSILD